MKNPFSSIDIHCWGGLGSQLFAANVAIEIQQKYPQKNICLVLHSGGVTKRIPEIPEIFPNFHYEFIDDYTGSLSAVSSSKKILILFKKLLFKFFCILGLLATLDNGNFHKIKFWTIAVRGHYSYCTISMNFLKSFYENLVKLVDDSIVFDIDSISIHYRLGDLLHLTEKGPIDVERIVQVLNCIRTKISYANLDIYSDSPLEALRILSGANLDIHFRIRDEPSSQLIFNCAQAKYFIGTSSKISFWIALVRSRILEKSSSLPNEKKMEFKLVTQAESLIDFY